jgi:hypothetical protein
VTIVGVAAALATVFGLVLVHVELTAKEVRLTTLQQKADTARVLNLKLRLEVAALESPARIVATARQLGMVPPPSITYLPGVPTGNGVATLRNPGAGPSGAGATQSGIGGWSVVKHADTGP